MKNISQYVMYLLVAIGAIVFVAGLAMGDPEDSRTWSAYNPMLIATYIYFGITLITALIASFYSAALKPESIKQTLIGFGAITLVFVISYALADDSVPEKYASSVSNSSSKLSGTGLYAFYILFFVAIASIVITSVLNLVKK
jgi:uncharacterized membrane protein